MKKVRVYERFPLAGSATLRNKGNEDNQTIHAMISNISFGGIGLYLDTQLKNNTDVSIDAIFTNIDGEIKTEALEGSTVYAKEMSGMYFTGIKFHEVVNPLEQPFLYKRIVNLSVF